MTKELVIAAYDRDLTWLEQLNPNIKKTIYRKGNRSVNPSEIFIDLNKGRCVHTFFYHLTTNYESLSDITYFVQDYPFDHWENIIEILNDSPTLYKEHIKIGGYCAHAFRAWSLSPSVHHIEDNESNYALMCQSNGLPHDTNPAIDVDKYWNLLFECPIPGPLYEFIPGGHFSITKGHVYNRSKEFYRLVTNLLIEEEVAPYIIERLECYIFNPKYKTKL